jgi:hypothetical protein
MLKCTPYIKNICQNINATLFAAEGAVETGGGSNPNSPRHNKAASEHQQPKQTEVRVTDLKTVKVDLIKGGLRGVIIALSNVFLYTPSSLYT